LDKYEPIVAQDGILIVNRSLVNRSVGRNDLQIVLIPASEIAESLGDKRMTNIVMVGALLAQLPVLPIEAIEKTLKDHLPERHKKLLPLNYEALRAGDEFVRKELTGQNI
jgi:2-oxoglutarate ferredoxin oxidoreductase subunit gamma